MQEYKILIATPTVGLLPKDYVESLNKLLTYRINNKKTIYGTSLLRCAIISNARNLQFFDAKDQGFDYIFYIDSDIVFPPNGLEKLINLDKDVATGIYYQRAYPHRASIYDFNSENRVINLTDWKDEPFKVDACGAGFLLIKKSVFDIFIEKEYEPFNLLKNGRNEWAGEDVSFCIRCKEKKIEIWTDPSIELGHIREDIVYKGHFECARTNNPDTCETIKSQQGWTSDRELEWLEKLASKMTTVLEIGAWKGRSTMALYKGCFNGLVYTVDHFKGSEELKHKNILAKEPSLFGQFATNVQACENLIVLKMPSEKAALLFPDKSIDMIFIDGSHTYEDVKKDIEMWTPKAKKLICGHDYTPQWINVMKAVDDSFGSIKFYETIWFKYL